MEQTASQRLKEVRVQGNFSQEEFAKEIGVSLSGYQLIEQGKRDVNTKILESLKNKFDVSADWLLFGENSKDSEDSVSTAMDWIDIAVKSNHLLEMLIPYYHCLWLYSVTESSSKRGDGESNPKLKNEYVKNLTNKFIEVDRFRNKFMNQNVASSPISKEDIQQYSELSNTIFSEFFYDLHPFISNYREKIIKDFWASPDAVKIRYTGFMELKVPKK